VRNVTYLPGVLQHIAADVPRMGRLLEALLRASRL
jgi:hypothetical protein